MKILKSKVVTKDNVSVSYVSVYFDHFKPIPLYHKESSYFGILKPIINEIFGLDYIPKYNPSYNPANLNNKLEINHQHLGFPRVLSWQQNRKSVVTNSGFFLILPEELKTPYDRMGHHIGLMMINNNILVPPLYPRPALCLTTSGPKILKPSISDITLKLSGDFSVGTNGKSKDMRSRLLCFGNDTQDSKFKIGKQERFLTISGDTIVEDKTNGEVFVPRTGILVRLAGDDCKVIQNNIIGKKVIFEVKGLMDSIHAIQCGPLLVKNREVVDINEELLEEKFFLKNGFRIPPSKFPIDTDSTRAARLAIGITEDNKFVAVIVGGSSSRVKKNTSYRNHGMTLNELAELMVSLDVQTAMNFDGGGSVQGFLNGGGSLVSSGERFHSFEAQFDRPVPYGLLLE